MAKKISVVLSGCGVMDGGEIHEAVLTLLAIDRGGHEAACLAPNIKQTHVVNHLTGEESLGEARSIAEAAEGIEKLVRAVIDLACRNGYKRESGARGATSKRFPE